MVPGRFRRADVVISPGRGATEQGVFYEPSDAIVSRSQILGEPRITPEPEQFPAVTWTRWQDALVTNNRYFPFLLHDNTLMLPPRRVEGPWRLTYRETACLSDGAHVIVDTKRGREMQVNKAIFSADAISPTGTTGWSMSFPKCISRTGFPTTFAAGLC